MKRVLLRSLLGLVLTPLLAAGCADEISRQRPTQRALASGESPGPEVTSGPSSATLQAPSLIFPSGPTHVSTETSLQLIGSCASGSWVLLSGAAQATTACIDGQFTLTLIAGASGTYQYSLTQANLTGVSASTSLAWTVQLLVPSAPILQSPAASSFISNLASLSISGLCTPGHTVRLGGQVQASEVTSPSGTFERSCDSGTFSFAVAKTNDGTYSLHVIQLSEFGTSSAPAALTWVRDTTPPAAPTLLSPLQSPFYSAASTLTLVGACEPGATVTLSGDAQGSSPCHAGSFSFEVSRNTDGTSSFSLIQTDLAGNQSPASNLEWVRDTTVPAAPALLSPGSSPYHSNTNELTLSGTCTGSYVVTLSGAITEGEVQNPPGSSQQSCANGSFSFTITKSSDGTYLLNLTQSNGVLESEEATLSWVRDTIAPPPPTIVTPATQPYSSPGELTISGSCEEGHMLRLTGVETQVIQQTTCVGASFGFVVTASSDGTYNHLIQQIDAAGNASTGVTVQWIRDTSVPPTPTLSTPQSNPLVSNSADLVLAGGCQSGLTVHLSGDLDEPQSQLCTDGTYAFTVHKSQDGAFAFYLKQESGGIESAELTVHWTRDTTPPETLLTSQPPSTNYSSDVSFSFESNEAGASFECRLDTGSFSACVSPVHYSGLSSGEHSFAVRARDVAGNLDPTPAMASWTQSSHSTLALYHFDSGAELTDSGPYAEAGGMHLTDFGTDSSSPGKFGLGRLLTASSSQYLEWPLTGVDGLGHTTLSIELWLRFTTIPGNNEPVVLISRSGSTGNQGWELKATRQGNKHLLSFSASLDGSSMTEVRSTSCSFDTTSWHHYAVTWDYGTVRFYCDGATRGSGSISGGTSGPTSIFATTAPLRIGRTEDMISNKYFNGRLDEVRLSQILRWTGAFTPPSSAYSPD